MTVKTHSHIILFTWVRYSVSASQRTIDTAHILILMTMNSSSPLLFFSPFYLLLTPNSSLFISRYWQPCSVRVSVASRASPSSPLNYMCWRRRLVSHWEFSRRPRKYCRFYCLCWYIKSKFYYMFYIYMLCCGLLVCMYMFMLVSGIHHFC